MTADALPMTASSSACTLPPPHAHDLTSHWPIMRVQPRVPWTRGIGVCNLTTIDKNPDGTFRTEPHQAGDICPGIAIPLERIYDDLERHLGHSQMSGYIINIGANDGVSGDPLYPLISNRPHLHGIALEPGAIAFADLKHNLQKISSHVLPINAGIKPSTAIADARQGRPKHAINNNSIDIIKIDIDSCDCHVLEALLADPSGYYRAKLIQMEVNHNIPVPISYKEMCMGDARGASGGRAAYDVWGCSVQAAYDVLSPHGYELLQYDWPDAVFILKEHAPAFPCMEIVGGLEQAYWTGYNHAREWYSRYPRYSNLPGWVHSLPEVAARAKHEPVRVLEDILQLYGQSWTKRPLWIEMSVAGTGVGLTVSSSPGAVPPRINVLRMQIDWHQSACDAVQASQRNAGSRHKGIWAGNSGKCGQYELVCRSAHQQAAWRAFWPREFINRHPRQFQPGAPTRLLTPCPA